MKIKQDREGDTLLIIFNDQKGTGSKIINENCIVTLDKNGGVVAIEFLDTSKTVSEPNKFDYTDITHPRYDQREKQENPA